MDLSRICINPRLRTSWEAIDLGFAMARQWYWPLFVCWTLPALLLSIAAAALLHDKLWLAYMLVWWSKPLLDRLPLHLLSRALFSEPISIRNTLMQLPSLWRVGFFPWLTWRRFSFTRSFDMPVTLLERLSGNPQSQRLNVLHRQNTGAATWLTIVCVHMEMLLVMGAISLVGLLIPDQTDTNVFQLAAENQQFARWAYAVLCVLSMALVAPFYIAGGFALYISRRIELEAWDVEIRFRHIIGKQRQELLAPLASVALIFLSVMFGSMPGNCLASTQPAPDNSAPAAVQTPISIADCEQARKLINEILVGEDFHVIEEVTRWRPKPFDADLPGDGLPEWFIHFIEWLEVWLFNSSDTDTEGEPLDLSGLAFILETFLWCALATGILAIIYVYRKEIHTFVSTLTDSRKPVQEKPRILFGLEVSEESLPRDVPAQVRMKCAEGDYRQALSLLYRSTLSGLMYQHGFTFYDSYTEGECVYLVRKGGDHSLSQFTEELTIFWQNLAYGHQAPPATIIDQLCIRWQAFFSNEE